MKAAIIYLAKNKMHALASQVYILATGLQNAAPPGTTGKSIQYLLEAATNLERFSKSIENLLPENQQQHIGEESHREP
jgi:hypothetical protein